MVKTYLSAGSFLLDSPFSSPAEAEKNFRLFREVEKIFESEGEPSEQPTEQRRRLDVGLMLAALHRPQPELELAWSHASRLAQLSDTELATSALPVLASCVQTHLLRMEQKTVGPADHQVAIRASTRIMGFLESDKQASGDTIVAGSYERVLAPTLSIADSYAVRVSEGNEPAIDPAVLEEFYAALGRLIWARRSARWPFAATSEDIAEETVRLFRRAIHLNGLQPGGIQAEKVAEYHLTLGHAELAKHDRDLDLVQGHADAVLELIPDYYGAHGLRSDIDLRRSRRQIASKDRFRFLDTAISNGEKAAEGSPPDEPLLVTWLLVLGTAYVERANFTRDLGFDTQKADLNRAIVHARKAAVLENAYPDYAYLTLGNAYEDLAWLVRDDVEGNYKKAISSFLAADRQTYRRAQAWHGLGRCYYKIVADSYVDTSEWFLGDLNRPDAEEMMAKAGELLAKATREAPDLANAFFYLGQVRLWQGDHAGAGLNFRLAKEAAYKKALPAVGIYAASWAAMGGLTGVDSDTVESRLEELEADTGPLAEVLHASARSLRVGLLVAAAKYDDALGEIGRALPADRSQVKPEDVGMIQQRIQCRIGQLVGQWSWETAKQALEDAELAVKLAFTRPGLSESLFLRGRVLGGIARQVVESEEGPPEEFRGTALSQLSRAIGDYRDAIRLVSFPKPSMVPYLKSPRAPLMRRYHGVTLVLEKLLLIRENKLGALSPEEVRRYVEELSEGIRWADEFLLVPETSGTDRTFCTQAKAAFEEERKKQSKVLSSTSESE